MKEKLIGRKIVSFKSMAFYIDGFLKSELIALFAKTGDGIWYKFSISEGKASIRLQEHEPTSTIEIIDGNKFEYPVKDLFLDIDYSESEVSNIQEYLWNGQKSESCGWLLSFRNNNEISFLDDDDSLIIIKGKSIDSLANCILD